MFAAGLSILLAAQANPQSVREFQVGLLRDVETLKSAYGQMHPGLYRYNTAAQMEGNFKTLRTDFLRCRNLPQAFVALSRFTAKVRCGHTYPNFFNRDQKVVESVFSGANRVPFHFRWIGGRMIVTTDLTSRHQLPAGTEIVTIDGYSCAKIRVAMLPLIRADGSNDACRIANLEVNGESKFEAFDIYLPLLFTIHPGAMTFFVKDVDGRTHDVEANPLRMEDRIAGSENQPATNRASSLPWSFAVSNSGIGILKMKTWALYDDAWDWKGFLAHTFEKLQSQASKGLILDLRGNGGGTSVGEEIASYLVQQPTPYDQYQRYTRYRKVDPALRPFLDTWDRSFDDWSPWTGPLEYLRLGNNRFFRMGRWDSGETTLIRPKGPHYGGKVVIIVDGSNSSATFQFDQFIQTQRLGRLVGEPTGGNQRGIDGSAFYFLHLPNSKLEVDLPLVGSFSATQMPDAGLQPDLKVVPTAKAISERRDEALQKALQICEHVPESQ